MINFHPSSGGELKPRISVIGVGGAGGNAVNNMIQSHLEGVEFIVANTDAQAMQQSRTDRRIQLGVQITQGLGAGARPEIGRAAAEESLDEIIGQIHGSNMVFITAGMGGGTGTGAAPVIARAARENGILTVGVVTKPFSFEGQHRMRLAEAGIEELSQYVDTLLIIPNQNLFRIASERTTFADAFKMADDVLYSGVRGVTDLMVMPGLINLDFADIRTVMSEMGKAMMGTGEAEGDKRALNAAEAAISNPLLEDISMKGARGVLVNITGGMDMTLFEVDEAANRIRDEVDPEANIIFGSTFDEKLNGKMRVSVVATGIDASAQTVKPTVLSVTQEIRRPAPQPRPMAAEPTYAQQPAAAPAQPVSQQPHVAQPHVAQPQAAQSYAAQPHVAQPQVREPAYQPSYRAEPQMTVREHAIPPAGPRMGAQAQPAMQAAPAQGSLRMDAPQPRHDARVEPQLDLHQSQPQPEIEPEAGLSHEQTNRAARLLNRLTQSIKTSQAYGQPAAPAPQAQRSPVHQPQGQSYIPQAQPVQPQQQPAPQAYVQQPHVQQPQPQVQPQAAQPQPTRVSPSDRLTTSRSDEDMLDIPAFLRRQAN